MPYYIHKYLPSENQDMIHGERIVETQSQLPFESTEFEGPFKTLKEIRLNSNIYQDLLKNNPKRAQKIFEENFIVKAENFIIFPDLKDNPFMNFIYKIMQHSSNGKFKSNDVSGIHLLSGIVRIVEVIAENKTLGIKKCIIEAFNERTEKWIKKSEPSTFFPENWGLQKLVNECYIAFTNKIQMDENSYRGKTSDNIEIEFIIKNNELKTLYPIV